VQLLTRKTALSMSQKACSWYVPFRSISIMLLFIFFDQAARFMFKKTHFYGCHCSYAVYEYINDHWCFNSVFESTEKTKYVYFFLVAESP
jgi:hypothetical protein